MSAVQINRVGYVAGFVASFIGHIIGAFIVLFLWETHAGKIDTRREVFTVTLEGGEKIGGFSQVPTEEVDKKKALPNIPEEDSADEEVTKDEVAEKKLETTSAVEDPEKILREKQEAEKKLALEKKKLEEQKKLEEEKKRKAEEEAKKKKKEEEDKKKAEEEKKKQLSDKEKREKDRKERDKLLQQRIKRASQRYKGESADAGGEGFGAASLGGKGMGGGTLASIEYIAYRNALEQHIKRGWSWLTGTQVLQAQVRVVILRDGTIQKAEIASSSGNSAFDESALRAVYKASPVPSAPEGLYEQFADVRITFDSSK